MMTQRSSLSIKQILVRKLDHWIRDSWNFHRNALRSTVVCCINYQQVLFIFYLTVKWFVLSPEQSVTGSSDIWFINFYHPMCSHCHTLAPVWRKVARELEGVVRIGAVNCDDDYHLCSLQGIRSYPTLMSYPGVSTCIMSLKDSFSWKFSNTVMWIICYIYVLAWHFYNNIKLFSYLYKI